MIGVLMNDVAREADGGNHQISEQRWLFLPNGIQLVIQNQELVENRVLKYSSFAQNGKKASLSSFLETLFIEDIHIQKHQDETSCIVAGSATLTFFIWGYFCFSFYSINGILWCPAPAFYCRSN